MTFQAQTGVAAPVSPALPAPRGKLSDAIGAALLAAPGEAELPAPSAARDALVDEDIQLSLYVLYELHYRGFDGVDPAWEWNPSLLGTRAKLEAIYLDALEGLVPRSHGMRPNTVGATLFELAAADEGPSLSRYLETQGTAEQLREFMTLRSAYQLKEADPHSWVIPRLDGDAKSALIEIQNDEYGSGRPGQLHSTLYAKAMAAVGLDPSYGAYLERIPGSALASVNLISLLGLHRRHRGALVGNLAMFEIGSAIPSRRYSNALERLELGGPDAREFYDEHVEADSVHENIAAYDLAQRLAMDEPALTDDILFGARALLAVDGLLAAPALASWQAGESALLAEAL